MEISSAFGASNASLTGAAADKAQEVGRRHRRNLVFSHFISWASGNFIE